METKQWSDTLVAETLETLEEMPMEAFMGVFLGRSKGVCMKHIGDKPHGYITMENCRKYKYIIQDHKSDEIIEGFASAQELVDAGWAVD